MPVAPAAAAPVQEMEPSPALQIIGKMKDTLMGRAIGILVADGSDGAAITKIKKAATDAGAAVKIVAPRWAARSLPMARCWRLTDNWLARLRCYSTQSPSSFPKRCKSTVDGRRRDRFRARCIRSSRGNRCRQGRPGAFENSECRTRRWRRGCQRQDAFIVAAKTRQWTGKVCSNIGIAESPISPERH